MNKKKMIYQQIKIESLPVMQLICGSSGSSATNSSECESGVLPGKSYCNDGYTAGTAFPGGCEPGTYAALRTHNPACYDGGTASSTHENSCDGGNSREYTKSCVIGDGPVS